MLLLSETDVRTVLSMADLIQAMESALAEFSAGRTQQPLRTVLEVGPSHAFFGVMPAFMPASGALGTKLVTVFGGNAAVGLPSHLATILLLDSTTGALLAVMDGRYITEARTAAVSAVSARLLAREDAGVLAILGSGVQARSHLARSATCARCARSGSGARARRIGASSPRRCTRDRRARSRPCRSAQEAVDGADLVVARHGLARAGAAQRVDRGRRAHRAVGACRPDQREMDTALVARARVFVDSRAGALAEAGDVLLPIREGAFDAGAHRRRARRAGRGTRSPGDSRPSEVTIFKSLGMAVEDVAAAHLAYERATERGLGRGIPW